MSGDIPTDLLEFYNQMKAINPSGTASFRKYFEQDSIYDFNLLNWKYSGNSSSFPTFQRKYYVCNIYNKNGLVAENQYKTISQIEALRKQGIEVHVFSWITPLEITDFEMEYGSKFFYVDEPAFISEVDEYA